MMVMMLPFQVKVRACMHSVVLVGMSRAGLAQSFGWHI